MTDDIPTYPKKTKHYPGTATRAGTFVQKNKPPTSGGQIYMASIREMPGRPRKASNCCRSRYAQSQCGRFRATDADDYVPNLRASCKAFFL